MRYSDWQEASAPTTLANVESEYFAVDFTSADLCVAGD